MSRPLKVLIVEDNEDDLELLLVELKRGGYEPLYRRVWTPEDFAAVLAQEEWDVVLSDFSLPRFNARKALELLKLSGKDLPFIIVSGSIGESVAVEAMKAGAHDFFSKASLTRLTAAIEREVKEATVRRERAATEQKLRQAEERYRLVVQHVRDYAIFFLDEVGRVATWSAGARRIFGYEESEAVGQPLSLFHENAFAHLERARTNGLAHDEGFAVRKDGGRFWAERDLELVRDKDRVLGFAVVLRDATERKRFVDELKAAISARDEFLSIASHELKTPLTSLKLQLESMTRNKGALAPADLTRKVDILKRQADRLTSLVGALLDVTKLSSGKLTLELAQVDLTALVSGYLQRASTSIEHSGSKVTLHANGPVVGSWDKGRLDTVVENLMSNALKFGQGKAIDVRIEDAGARARLSVTDRGIGIAQEDQARIFGRFERAVPEVHYGGLGIGLWLARQVVEAHGGNISVQSRAGEGSTFTVELPR